MAFVPMRVALIYDMDACKGPTGVTRHAMAQLRGLAREPQIALQAISGRITEPDGRAFWESLAPLRRHKLPLRTRDMLRAWRLVSWPSIEFWSGEVDWIYAPAEYFVPTRKAKLAVTSHDVLQDVRFGGERRRERLAKAFGAADLILSVSKFNTEQLIEHFPSCHDRVAYVPNGAEDLFFEPATEHERNSVRADLRLPATMPFLLSVANFQERKNLVRLIRAAGRLSEVRNGEMAVVLLGDGSESEARSIREEIEKLGSKVIIRMPGYRQGLALRAIYSEALALVFPSLCESFGIPAVEAMACGCPALLADSTALPEVGGEAGWYFEPENEDAISETIRNMIDLPAERATKVQKGREIASGWRWAGANERLIRELLERR